MLPVVSETGHGLSSVNSCGMGFDVCVMAAWSCVNRELVPHHQSGIRNRQSGLIRSSLLDRHVHATLECRHRIPRPLNLRLHDVVAVRPGGNEQLVHLDGLAAIAQALLEALQNVIHGGKIGLPAPEWHRSRSGGGTTAAHPVAGPQIRKARVAMLPALEPDGLEGSGGGMTRPGRRVVGV